MKATTALLRIWLFCAFARGMQTGSSQAQSALSFTNVQRLSNRELGLTVTAPIGASYRIETASDTSQWAPLVTFPTNTSTLLQHTDSAAPFLQQRYYRALQLTNSNVVAGDHLATDLGTLVLQPRNHAAFVMSWNGQMIYVDPADAASFTGLPKADLVLVTHSHSDHFSRAKIDSVRATKAVIIAPQDVYSQLSTTQKG